MPSKRNTASANGTSIVGQLPFVGFLLAIGLFFTYQHVNVLAPECSIKANVSENGKIYHLPGQRYYNATKVNVLTGERWFCSEAEARAAGWRRSRI